jgi:hypothetical protein
MGHIDTLTSNSQIQGCRLALKSTFIAVVIFMSEIATYLIVDAVFTPDPIWLKRIQ